eukprot:gb/GEZN01012749.1/.p1 GENE.gb/GEZN01012749.1/~~gb/GEZN01012749.1/.p1  ORF type:complete len:285 (-),score=27.93 gb/GEZN01012749.1/:150-1004(-)
MSETSSSRSRAAELVAAAAFGGLVTWALLRSRRLISASSTSSCCSTSSALRGPERVARSPQPGWKPGQPQLSPYPTGPGDMLSLAPSELKNGYNFFTSAYVPRPIALVSTISKDGVPNIAPFSYSGLMNHDPPVLLFSCCEKRRAGGDTLHNAEATKECVVHIVSDWYLEAANYTCGNFAPEVNEFTEAGLSMIPSDLVGPPRAAEAAIAFECKVDKLLPINNDKGNMAATVVICRVVRVHINKHVYNKETGTIDAVKLRPMARLGGVAFSSLGYITDIDRPVV